MSSDNVGSAELGIGSSSDIARLLDPAVGFLVWAGHLIVIYIANALTCALRLTSRYPFARSTLVIALAASTIVAVAIVVLHGLRRYRQRKATRDQRFLVDVAVGSDAIATLAIVWQLIPIFMSPVCR